MRRESLRRKHSLGEEREALIQLGIASPRMQYITYVIVTASGLLLVDRRSRRIALFPSFITRELAGFRLRLGLRNSVQYYAYRNICLAAALSRPPRHLHFIYVLRCLSGTGQFRPRAWVTHSAGTLEQIRCRNRVHSRAFCYVLATKLA